MLTVVIFLKTNKQKRGKLNETLLEMVITREMNGPEQMGQGDLTM